MKMDDADLLELLRSKEQAASHTSTGNWAMNVKLR